MIGQRFITDVLFSASDRNGTKRLRDHLHIKRQFHHELYIPAGYTTHQVLDSVPVAGSGNRYFVSANTDTEGVEVWPIDSASPSTSYDTSEFGWIFDFDASVHSHDHGAKSTVLSNHAAGAENFHGSDFPCWVQVAEDVADQTGAQLLISDIEDAPTPLIPIHHNGHVMSLPTENEQERVAVYMLGNTGYKNFGAKDDGLGFTAVFYLEDADSTKMNIPYSPRLRFFSYPFTRAAKSMDLIGSTTGLGDTIWAADDQLLCPNGLKSGGGAIGYLIYGGGGGDIRCLLGSQTVGGALAKPPMTGAPGELNDGYSSVFMPKVVTDPPAYSGSEIATIAPADSGGILTWERITMIAASFSGLAGSGSLSNHLVNVYFGPRPGRLHILRPFVYLVGNLGDLWSQNSVPTLGIRNPHGVPVNVQIDFGTDF